MALAVQKYQDPFDHWIIDDFLPRERAMALCHEFPDYDHEAWYRYHSPLERKRTIREWALFGPETYRLFHELASAAFLDQLREITGHHDIRPDMGLHGAGWHIQGPGDHLNMHLDYARHPRLHWVRKFNLILYLTPDWQDHWAGALEFWSHDPEHDLPHQRRAVITPRFNRAVIFDTTQDSWHGVPEAVACPPGMFRRSIAMYYLSDQAQCHRQNARALYAPGPDQARDPSIMEIIAQRCR